MPRDPREEASGDAPLTQYGLVEAGFHGEVGEDVGQVELPKVSKEEVEATLMVLFAAPLQGLGLGGHTCTNTPKHTQTLAERETHRQTHRHLCYENRISLVWFGGGWRPAPLF